MARPRPTLLNTLKSTLPRNSKLLIAVSGGRDSVALLHAAASLRRVLSIKIEVAHVDHGLRRSSRADAKFVKQFCRQLKLPFHLKRCKKKPKSANAEAWGRKQRYDFFQTILKSNKLDFVLTAHNANDVAETLLMRLVSNKELRGIEEVSLARSLIRPMLTVPRYEIDKYVRANGLKFREDETNRDTAFLRNRVRAKLIPLLEREFDRRIVETLASCAQRIAEDLACLDEMAIAFSEFLAKERFGSRDWLRQTRELLGGLNDRLRWRVAQRLLFPKLGFNLGRDRCCEVVSFINGNAPRIELPAKVRLERKRGEIALIRGTRG